jgi:hypothetical protein
VTRVLAYVVAYGLCAASFVAVGVKVGREHPGAHRIVVHTDRRSLHELPRWACREIVDLREQKIELFHEVVRAYTKPRDLKHSFFFKFGTGNRGQCR